MKYFTVNSLKQKIIIGFVLVTGGMLVNSVVSLIGYTGTLGEYRESTNLVLVQLEMIHISDKIISGKKILLSGASNITDKIAAIKKNETDLEEGMGILQESNRDIRPSS